MDIEKKKCVGGFTNTDFLDSIFFVLDPFVGTKKQWLCIKYAGSEPLKDWGHI